jgi:succinate dehydrogenase flavin-adding protein (antitoxin of CptAB toxin-antitoxin module)
MVNIANKTITNYIDSLNESEKKQLKSILAADDKVLNEEFNNMQTKVVEKLSGLKESESDNVVKVKLQETIDKVSNETYNKIGYYKLKNLFENI